MSKRAAASSTSRQVRSRAVELHELLVGPVTGVLIGGEDVDLHSTSLDVSDNELRALPEAIAQLVALQKLSVCDNKLRALPDEIGELVALQELDVSCNKLGALPEAIGQLVALQHLDVSYNQLCALPKEITQLVKLQTLNVYHNQLGALPKEITQLVKLQELDVSDNQLRALPEAIGKLVTLQKLDVSRNQLRALPEAIGKLVKLQRLDVEHNQLGALPEALDQLVALQYLDVSYNQLCALPKEITQLVKLQELDVSNNQLRALPEAIAQLVALQKLNVCDNKLRALPDEIGELVALQELNVSVNQLGALPEALGQLVALQFLYVDHNQLRALPEAIGKLIALHTLMVYNNQLRALPEAIGSLQMLGDLRVWENPLQRPPLAIADQGIDAIRRYFEALRLGRTVSRTCKLVMVGDGLAGKTSLLRGWRNGCQPSPAAPEARTVNVELATTPLTLDATGAAVAADDASADIHLSCWDLGGQVEYSGVQQAYLTLDALYVLVVHARKTRSDADAADLCRWLDCLQACAPGAAVQPFISHDDSFGTAGARARARRWLSARFREHEEHHAQQPVADGESRPPVLRIQYADTEIPCVNASSGGNESLVRSLQRLHAVATTPGLLPIIGQQLPATWAAAMGFVRAVCKGTNGCAAARAVILEAAGAVRPARRLWRVAPSPPRLYMPEHELRALWESAAAEVVVVLERDQLGEDKAVLIDSFRLSEMRTQILDEALRTLSKQGEIFVAAGIVYLDPAFITSLVSPLLDHQLRDKLDERRDGTVWAELPPQFAAMCKSFARLLVEQAQLQPALLDALWPHQLIRAADRPSVLEHLEHPDVGLLMKQAATPARALHLSDEHYWLVPMRLCEDVPADLASVWPDPGTDGALRLRFELLEGLPLPLHMGIRERCVAAFQKACPVLRCWRSGAVLGLPGAAAAAAMLRVEATAIIVEVRTSGDGKDGLLLHKLHSIVLGVQDRYRLPWRPPPSIPSNQGYEGTCVAHSLLKVVIAQLDAKYGISIDFDRHIQSVIEAADCLSGAHVPDVAERVSNMRTGLASSSGERFQIRVEVQTYESFDQLLGAVSNSQGHIHIVTGTSNHAVVAERLHGAGQVRCRNSHARVGHGAHSNLTRSAFHDFDIVSTTITAKWVPNLRAHVEGEEDGSFIRADDARSGCPAVRESWLRLFGSTMDDLKRALGLPP
ncbi:miro domain-containing protein [Emiliania huxleyi CCMP1516]|uniref:Disease resistance R13L4/SHOC-2-like LRR domain-containing protein n=2 Tax=Emiliania huxleyi TaxID=2903 RepID=A0A0D3JAX9_EMIH1|nr:miro domain-containing protein [Emiliania huxleyi CCMP1516]EOD20664.1 miro domain-containing protein [Emiliania huxleyi CCMP1516]|eukprot:XP_005773093.1 miro domain-containing protein [Emiliania huxleyi CCMP1516]